MALGGRRTGRTRGQQILLQLHIFYQFFIHNRPNPNTWFKMFKSAPLPETMGAVATLFLAPAFLLKKLSSTSEFKDTANFCITLGAGWPTRA